MNQSTTENTLFRKVVKQIFGWGLWINAFVLIPQSLQLFQTKNADGVSLITFAFFFVLQLNGFFRGLHIEDKVMGIGLLLSAIVTSTIVAQIIIY